jgi:hypothetical protein
VGVAKQAPQPAVRKQVPNGDPLTREELTKPETGNASRINGNDPSMINNNGSPDGSG